MKIVRFTETQIISILKQQEAGLSVKDLAREHGISEATFYNWNAKYAGMEANEVKRMKELEEENSHNLHNMDVEKTNTINTLLSRDLWTDFEIVEFDGFALTIICGIDLPYNWVIKVTFNLVTYLSIKNDWKRHDKLPAFEIWDRESARQINLRNRIEIGNVLFKINHDDVDPNYSNAYIIAAQSIDFLVNPLK
jgi:hypothetical protein